MTPAFVCTLLSREKGVDPPLPSSLDAVTRPLGQQTNHRTSLSLGSPVCKMGALDYTAIPAFPRVLEIMEVLAPIQDTELGSFVPRHLNPCCTQPPSLALCIAGQHC